MRRFSLPIVFRAGLVIGAGFASGAHGAGTLIERIGVDGRRLAVVDSSATEAPRVAIEAIGTPASRASLPASSPYRDPTLQIAYRHWLTRGRADFGLGIGTLVETARPAIADAAAAPADAAPSIAPNAVLMVGMRYRASDGSMLYADAARLYGVSRDSPGLVAKVGVEFKSAESRWNVAYGGLGMRLAGDTNMSVRLRKGGFKVVMRRSF